MPSPLGLRLLTPLLSQVGARPQAPGLFILTLLYPSMEPGIFVFLFYLDFSLIYKDSLINFYRSFYCFANLSCLGSLAMRPSLSSYAL